MKMNKLKYKILTAIIISGLIPFSFIGYSQYVNTVSKETANTYSELEKDVTSVDKLITEWFDYNKRAVISASEMQPIKKFHEAADTVAEGQVISTFAKNYPWFTVMFTVDIQGQQRFRSDDGKLININDKKNFQNTLSGNKRITVTPVISADYGQPSVTFMAPIFDKLPHAPDVENKIGIVGARVEIKNLTDIINAYNTGKSSNYIYMMNKDGDLVTHPVLGKDGQSLNINDSEEYSKALKGGVFEFVSQKKKNMIGYSKTIEGGWILVFAKDKDAMLASIQKESYRQAILLLVALGLIALAALIITAWIVRPINSLTEIANGISKGKNVESELNEIDRGDEIGDLANSIKRINNSMKQAMAMLKK